MGLPIYLAATFALAETLVLQQDTNEYSGCIDSYIETSGYAANSTTNYGASSNLLVNTEHYNPG